jgi:hypothetical protein
MKKEKKLKVWGGRYYTHDYFPEAGPQKRMLIGAYTKKQAMELGGISRSEMNNYFCETGNDVELATVTEVGVWLVSDYGYESKILSKIK